MKKIISVCTFATLIFCSCSSLKTISYSEYRSLDPIQSLHAVPLVADLQVSETSVTYSEKISIDITKIKPSEAKKVIDDLKAAVLLRATQHYKSDVIIAPLVDVHNEGINSLVITITGYPATYHNIRNASKDDSWFIQFSEPKTQVIPASASKSYKLFNK